MTGILEFLDTVPVGLSYLLLAVGAALENVVPAIPADTFVALGGFLAGAGAFDARWVALATWSANVAGALTVYRASRLYGPSFFDRGLGRHLVRQHQMERMRRFYERWGLPAIFLSRFVPGVRAIVPVFAGATGQPARRVIPPIVVASGMWYGTLVLLGLWAGQNLDVLARALSGLNRSLAVAGAVIAAALFAWWWSTRHPHE